MQNLAEILKPIERSDGRRTAMEVYEYLQGLILSGKLKPGTIVSQVALAKALNVSRTPVREAVRMLQEAGLLEGEVNFRPRVVGFNPAEIEALYLKRMALEPLGVALTTSRMSKKHLKDLRDTVSAMESPKAHQNFDEWQRLHRRFHSLLVHEAGQSLVADLAQLQLHSERYQIAYKATYTPNWWQRGEAEHRELLTEIEAGKSARAAELSARHLARSALELLASLAPEYDTSRVRATLRFAIDGAKNVD